MTNVEIEVTIITTFFLDDEMIQPKIQSIIGLENGDNKLTSDHQKIVPLIHRHVYVFI